jgi:hypothetical protein
MNFDSNGDLIVVDYGNGAIRKISQDSIVTTISRGDRSPNNVPISSFNGPVEILAVEDECFLVTDSWRHIILKLFPNGTVSVFVGSIVIPGFADGVGTFATFRLPQGMAKDSSGFIYVTESGNNAIRKISPTGNVTTLAGNGSAGFVDGIGREARFRTPRSIVFDNASEIFVADTDNHAIRKILSNGTVVTIAGFNGPGYVDGHLTQAKLGRPMKVTLDKNNDIIFSDGSNQAIRKIDRFGNVITIIGPTTQVPNSLPLFIFRYWGPSNLIEDENGNLYVSSGIDLLWKFNCSSNSRSTNLSNAITLATPDADLPSWEDVTIVDQLPYDSFPLEYEYPSSDSTNTILEATPSYQVTVTHTSESHYTETSATALNPTETQTRTPVIQSTTIIELFKHLFDLTTLPGLLTVIGSTSILLLSFGCFLYCCIRRYRGNKALKDFETQPKISAEIEYSSMQHQPSYVQSVESSTSYQSSNRTATLFTDPQGTKEKKHLFLHEKNDLDLFYTEF